MVFPCSLVCQDISGHFVFFLPLTWNQPFLQDVFLQEIARPQSRFQDHPGLIIETVLIIVSRLYQKMYSNISNSITGLQGLSFTLSIFRLYFLLCIMRILVLKDLGDNQIRMSQNYSLPLSHVTHGQSQNSKASIEITVLITGSSQLCFHLLTLFFPYLSHDCCIYVINLYTLHCLEHLFPCFNSVNKNMFRTQPQSLCPCPSSPFSYLKLVLS